MPIPGESSVLEGLDDELRRLGFFSFLEFVKELPMPGWKLLKNRRKIVLVPS